MNHELNATQGVVRRHDQVGAFVSRISIDRRTFEVEEGADTIDPGVRYWNYTTQTYQSTGSPPGRTRATRATPSSRNPTPSPASAPRR
jgi:hypothetical protein